MFNFGSVLTAMVTPFTKNLEVDYRRAQELAEKLIAEGSDGLVVAGTTGESPTITAEEKLALFREIKRSLGKRAFVIAGTGTNSTRDTIALTRAAEEIGVDGVLVVTPYYNKPPQEGVYQHYLQVAKNTKLPIIVYNIPGRTATNITPETMEKLAAITNIVAVKDSTGNLDQISDVIKRVGSPSRLRVPVLVSSGASCEAEGATSVREITSNQAGFVVYSGDDSLTLPILSVGGVGVVSVATHIVGKEIKRMIDSYSEGRVEEARDIHLRFLSLIRALFLTTNPIMVKAALKICGFDVGGLRPPLLPAKPEEEEKMRQVLADLGILAKH